MQVRLRLRQFSAALTATITPAEQLWVESLLTPAELRLFRRMPRFDQRHCLDVAAALARTGSQDRALLAAALLHDCGKVADSGRCIPLIYYGIFVILRRWAPSVYLAAARDGRGLLWPFVVHAAHEARSVALVEAAGSAPELIEILRAYAVGDAIESVCALRRADDQY